MSLWIPVVADLSQPDCHVLLWSVVLKNESSESGVLLLSMYCGLSVSGLPSSVPVGVGSLFCCFPEFSPVFRYGGRVITCCLFPFASPLGKLGGQEVCVCSVSHVHLDAWINLVVIIEYSFSSYCSGWSRWVVTYGEQQLHVQSEQKQSSRCI